jgi:hypothetical protein
LQVEGGSILEKNGKTLDDYNVRNGSIIGAEMVEKISTSTPK